MQYYHTPGILDYVVDVIDELFLGHIATKLWANRLL